MADNNIFLARQPIFDRLKSVIGYELLYRDGLESNSANIIDGNQATARVLLNTFVEIGLDTVTNRKLAFVNLTRDFVTGALDIPVKTPRLVLEILENIKADSETLNGIRNLKNQGFKIALDDFVPSEHNLAFVRHAKIVKLNINGVETGTIQSQVDLLRNHSVRLLAEKVETMEQYRFCHDLGFDYFQGYFFSRPSTMRSREIPPNQLAVLELIAKLQSSDCSMDDIELIVRRDLGMSYKLLRVINSSFYNLGRKIDSVKHALIMLGTRTLKSWMTVFSMSMLNNKPMELVHLALQRARMCELLSARYDCRGDTAFTVGLFSLLDVMMDRPLGEVLAKMPFTPQILNALLERKGPLGEILTITENYEHARWGRLKGLPYAPDELRSIYFETLAWTNEVSRSLKDGISSRMPD